MQFKEKGLTRRQFIKKSAGAMGLLSLVSSPLLPILGRAKASETDSGEDHQQEKKHAWSMVIDLKRCDGCTGLDIPPQCTQACISGHFAPKGHKWIEIYDVELPGGGKYFLPMPCYQCENAPCVNVCPVGATYHDKDGVVLIDHHRCIGCRMCMAACPYQRRFFNWGKPEVPPEASLAEYSPLYPVPAVRGTVIKCMFCAHYLQDGRLPYCVTACPRKALYIGDLNQDIAGNGTEIVKLSKFLGENDAFRNKEDLGTQPRVFYLPGHGQDAGRKADDDRPLLPNTWAWGGEGYNKKVGVWPWEKEVK